MPSKVFPSIRICCPCSSDSLAAPLPLPTKALAAAAAAAAAADNYEEDDKPFDPRSPRAAFSLYPLNHLLYCEDCNQVRCPRCVHDEIVCYYCPHCLFEVPSSTVKSEGNRCTRNCFYCPICSAILSVTATGEPEPKTFAPTGPYTLMCNHCHWTTKEIGIEFEKPTSITAQLAQKLRPLPSTPSTTSPSLLSPMTAGFGAGTSSSYFTHSSMGDSGDEGGGPPASDEEAFLRLKGHYNHLKAAASADDYGSSGSLSRLMGIYNISGASGASGRIRSYGASALTKTSKNKESWTEWEHARAVDASLPDEDAAIAALRTAGYDETASQAQRLAQANDPRLLSSLRPLAALLRTKRSKRCRMCRHILVKPESKVSSIRFRIKLVAMNYIPALSFSRRDPGAIDYQALRPGSTHQFLLTVTNPLFDPVEITLATPLKTPGPYPATVTILCPEFEIGANTDVWEEALASGDGNDGAGSGRMRRGAAGKKSGLPGQIWDSGRNWTTVCIEIVPPHISESVHGPDRVVAVPILVRAVYETEIDSEDMVAERRGAVRDAPREKREHSYWSVLEVGIVGARDDNAPDPRPVSMMVAPQRSPVEVALGKGSRLSMR